jgi:AcrR family transcriptional regulator
MERIVEVSGIAKTTIYRHFPTKDALVEAFLKKEDAEFWSQWDAVIAAARTPADQLDALCDWIAVRVTRDGYRGCPQVNVAAELADPTHPARLVARRHKAEMHRRLTSLCGDMPGSETVSMQIALLFDGAFMSDGRLCDIDAAGVLRGAVRRLTGIE